MTFALWKRAGLRFGLWVGVCGPVDQCLGLWISMVLWVGFRVCGSVCGFVDRCVGFVCMGLLIGVLVSL